MAPEVTSALIWPVVAMVVLTIMVWLRMFQTRVGEMKRRRIHPQSVATSSQMLQSVEDSRAADNFRNLFELPVLFYTAIALALYTGAGGTPILVLAWVFVALRVLHSAIHCTYNKVIHRFRAYVFGGFVLWALWAVLLASWLA